MRDKSGKIIQAAAFQKGEDETKPGRVQPDRRWFGTVMLRRKNLTIYLVYQETLEWFRRPRWNISGLVLVRERTIRILCC